MYNADVIWPAYTYSVPTHTLYYTADGTTLQMACRSLLDMSHGVQGYTYPGMYYGMSVYISSTSIYLTST